MDFLKILTDSKLPEALYMFILNSSGVRYNHNNEKKFIESIKIYEQFVWRKELISLTVDQVTKSIFFKNISFYPNFIASNITLRDYLKEALKNYKTSKDLFLIKNLLLSGARNLVNLKSDLEPIILIKTDYLTIVDGIHRILSLFVEEDKDIINISAWVGSNEEN